MRSRLAVLFTLVSTLGLVLAACGDDDATTSPTTTGDDPAPTTTSEPAGPEPTLAPDDEVPGERIEIFPYEDAELAVIGVADDDTLNVRAGPGVDYEVLYELDPLATGIIAEGHNRSLEGAGFWSKITADGETGWANTAFLAHLGQVVDITDDVAPADDPPRAETMLELGETIGAMRATEDPPSDIVVVDGPTVDADGGEIVVDVVGFGDDAVTGERLHITAEADAGGESFTVTSVEVTALCTRGVTDDGLCV